MAPSIIAPVGPGGRIIRPVVRAVVGSGGALARLMVDAPWHGGGFNRLIRRFADLRCRVWRRRHGFRLPGGGLLFHHSGFLFARRASVPPWWVSLPRPRQVLLHGLAALPVDELLALNRENDLSGSGQPDRHAAAGRHDLPSRPIPLALRKRSARSAYSRRAARPPSRSVPVAWDSGSPFRWSGRARRRLSP